MGLITTHQAITEGLKKHEVIPHVCQEFEPSLIIQAEYENGGQALLGNNLTPEETKKAPKIRVLLSDSTCSVVDSATYTLCMTDPDAPTRENPDKSEICHWLATGIKIGDDGYIDFSRANELQPYIGPGPPPKTGLHRYIFLLFRNDSNDVGNIGNRYKWGYESDNRIGALNYAKENGLSLIGTNFFLAQNSEQ